MMTSFRRLTGVAAALLVSIIMLAATPVIAQSPGPLDGRMFGGGNAALVVVLHGDVSKGGPANYHYDVAERIAQQNKGASVFALLRPGYSDGKGGKSKGSNNNRRDHYTAQNNALVAQTIAALAKQTGNRKVVVVGHSGGAAQVATILGTAPGLIGSAILVSCPCNIPEWRAKRGKKAWRNSQSPHDFVGKIARPTRIIALSGTKDTNTFPQLSQDYIAAAKARGLAVAYVPVNGAGHDFRAFQSTVEQLVKSEIAK